MIRVVKRMMKKSQDLRFFVHEDIEVIRHLMPLAWYDETNKYIMQENRVVYVGSISGCINFMKNNNGELMPLHPFITNSSTEINMKTISRLGKYGQYLTDEKYALKCKLVAEREAFFSIPDRLCEALSHATKKTNHCKMY